MKIKPETREEKVDRIMKRFYCGNITVEYRTFNAISARGLAELLVEIDEEDKIPERK